MFQWVVTFIKTLLGLNKPAITMENLSTLAPEKLDLNLTPELPLFIPENITTLTIEAWVFNLPKNILEKVKITLQEDIQDIIQITPWGLVGLNSEYQLVQLSFLPDQTFLMNTPEFQVKVQRNGEDLKFQSQSLDPTLVLLPKTVLGVVETIKQKSVTYPIITGAYLEQNKTFLSEAQLEQLFQSVLATPVNSLLDSLSVLDQQLAPSPQRVYGHRWNLNASVYYSESKLAALDRVDLNLHDSWNETYPNWQTGLVGVIILNQGRKMLFEVIATGEDHLWVVDRQLAVKLLLAGESKEQCLLKCQSKVLLSEITRFFIAQN